MKKKLTVVAALVLVLAMGVGGTLAYLTDKTDAVTNTFTVGNVKIELTETENGDNGNFALIPGTTYDKNPTVTVKAGSEACWLFVKVEGTNNPETYLDYAINTGDNAWTALGSSYAGIYYIKQDAVASGAATLPSYSVLKDDEVTVKTTVGSTTVPMPEASAQPTLTFTAYAIQQANIGTDETTDAAKAAAAWAELNSTT